MKQLALFAITVSLLFTRSFADESVSPNSPTLDGDIVGLWLMGQSLCEGAESLPIVTPNDPGWGNFRFQRGVRTWTARQDASRPESRPDDQFALVPLTATTYGGLGETIANGLADHL